MRSECSASSPPAELRRVQKRFRFKRLIDDFPAYQIVNIWNDVAGAAGKIYVVQTSPKVVERCLLMTTDPGESVSTQPAESGTTGFVAEQWGRRWITIDTSRVAIALARSRLMGARYPYYILADSPEGQRKEAEVARTAPKTAPTRGDIRLGFIYERIPHITLKSIANNAEIEVISEKWQRMSWIRCGTPSIAPSVAITLGKSGRCLASPVTLGSWKPQPSTQSCKRPLQKMRLARSPSGHLRD